MKALFFAIILIIAGCGSVGNHIAWVKNDSTINDLRTAEQQCEMYARQMGLMAASGSANPWTRGALQGMEERRSYQACMEAKGWRRVN